MKIKRRIYKNWEVVKIFIFPYSDCDNAAALSEYL